ncbi:alpha/beta fold hydrolase [Aureimonas fodinaquatilis]|uniref:Alpha/beta fold hydrolase n=1 Tax=Aureimonas fodinaquatilis TaxID=2565783 RepID=A0A5B0DXF5_9HYPH|nr:alpha/beta fold hydrolase [Aureimonas fodinaquatilis]KAA0970565.1 alpha/beta fold hydrolase [Aureimonas fodinaquatilis]
MGLIFKQDFHDDFASWLFAYIRTGGPEIGEMLQVAKAVGDGDDGDYYECWSDLGDRLVQDAENSLRKGNRESARASLLKATCAFGTSYHPIFGEPVDQRLLAGFTRQMAAFEKAMSLSPVPASSLRIPFEGRTMPGWLIPAKDHASETRPLIIFTNGYDGQLTDMYFASAVAASERGYHCLIFDGPGQGEMLYEHGVRLRPDWEVVVSAVLDFAIELPNIDTARIAISGWSLGGYLSPRAASGDPRLAACIADPGQISIARSFSGFATKLGVPANQSGKLADVDDAILAKLAAFVETDRRLHWSFVQRGFWVHGVQDLRSYLKAVEPYTLEGRIDMIRCPTLLVAAENDPLAANTAALFEQLNCPSTLIQCTTAEGAGEHCEMRNRSLLNDRVLDWLDSVFSN